MGDPHRSDRSPVVFHPWPWKPGWSRELTDRQINGIIWALVPFVVLAMLAGFVFPA